tara:strand:- start:579 stop:887 length:309 start_codon:yes stop_codon:yes gene_type:complete
VSGLLGSQSESLEHIEVFEHLFIDDEQKRPVDASQKAVPQAQSSGFTAFPSVTVQAAVLVHVLEAKLQKRPVDASQLLEPHAQFSEFSELPSVVVQASIISV